MRGKFRDYNRMQWYRLPNHENRCGADTISEHHLIGIYRQMQYVLIERITTRKVGRYGICCGDTSMQPHLQPCLQAT